MPIARIPVCVAILALAALGQVNTGLITGVVTDPVGEVARNATVQAKNTVTGTVSRTSTTTNGSYTVGDLPVGNYDVTVSVVGMPRVEKKGLAVRAAKATQLDIRLREGTQLRTLGEDGESILADLKKHLPPTGPTPRMADGKPDLSGVWWSPMVTEAGEPEWTAYAEKIAKERTENYRRDAPQAHCLPAAILRRGPLYQFVQTKDIIVEISDDDSPGFHQIYLEHQHPHEPDSLWYGDTVARWEGDTLVVDRVNFDERGWLDQESHPHSAKLHIVERIRRPDLGHLEIEVVVEDPEVLATPWTFKSESDLAAGYTIREFICMENNRDPEHMVGK